MRHKLFFVAILLTTLSAAVTVQADIFLREDFSSLENWDFVYFPKIKKHSSYSIEKQDNTSVLRTESRGSASALVMKKEFDIRKYPKLRWRWKVDNVYRAGNGRTKKGDDYPIRIYVMFRFDEATADSWEILKYKGYQMIYGEYPPRSTLVYAWGNHEGPDIFKSPYTDKARIILKQQGTANLKKWITEEVDIVADYEKAFGSKPPSVASIGVMNDSDNTGEHAVSYIDFIEVYR